ncbi:MAG: hypothetical protein JEY96_13550 [Bacteroidales bacterium]|nr:hypothetical protein [Bacteroidales bacterium]
MNRLKKIAGILLLSILFFNIQSQAQFYSTGQDPASAKWEQINTINFQIIFQTTFSDKAQKVANILEYYYNKVGVSLGHEPKKISVVLHNQTISSNGYVGWAPKRMELYVTPSQDLYPDPWFNHLCIHELRHVVQIDKLNQGITKILSIVFGQQATGLVAGQMPFWYLEGDAVCTETAFSEYGRGRLPSFNQAIKTHLLSDEERFSYDKMLFGSYQEYVPNRYELGYQLTAFARSKYGSSVWSNVQNHVAKNSYTLLPTSFAFYRGLKKNIGQSQKELYTETMNFLDSLWTIEQIENKTIEPRFFQTTQTNDYEDYLNPIFIDSEQIIALKKGYSHIPQFVLISQDGEQVIHEPGVLVSNDFTYTKNILVWAEYKPDIRWQNREYNSIKLLNVKTGIDFTLVQKSRYFSPAISKHGDKIAVVEIDEGNQSSIVILNSLNGKVENKILSRDSNYLQRPQWSYDGKSIFVIEQTDEGKQVSSYNFEDQEWYTEFKIDKADIQRIVPTKSKVYFHSTLNGIDNIYVFDQINDEIYQISNSKYGISQFDIAANNNTIVTNEKTSQGFRLASIPLERALWKKIRLTDHYNYKLADVLSEQEKEINLQDSSKLNHFEVKPYRKALNVFNFHSWIPFYFDYNNLSLGSIVELPSEMYENLHPGLMLLSQNKLSSVESILSYGYKNGDHFLSSSVIIKGQYPVVKLSAEYGNEQLIVTSPDATWKPVTNVGYTYGIDLYVPLSFSRGKFISGFIPQLSIDYKDNLYYNSDQDYYIKGNEFVQTQLLYYSYKRPSKKDIIPQLGAIFRLNLYNTPFESKLFGYLYNANSIFYLPGGKNKAFKIDFGYQYQEPDLYLYNSDFNFPRGIEQKRTEKMLKLYTDYVFPIAYPEWNLGSFIYLKRLRGNIFADYAYNSYRKASENGSFFIWPHEHNLSCGVELKADYHLLRTIFPLTTGVRLGYSPTEEYIIFDVLFSVDLNGL